MSNSVDLKELLYALKKHEDDARVDPSRNRAYANGLRDAQKIALSLQTHLVEESIPTTGGIPREGTWWYECDKCHCSYDVQDKYCRKCGRRINWNDHSEND